MHYIGHKHQTRAEGVRCEEGNLPHPTWCGSGVIRCTEKLWHRIKQAMPIQYSKRTEQQDDASTVPVSFGPLVGWLVRVTLAV